MKYYGWLLKSQLSFPLESKPSEKSRRWIIYHCQAYFETAQMEANADPTQFLQTRCGWLPSSRYSRLETPLEMWWVGPGFVYHIFLGGGVVINLLDISFDLTQAWLVSGFSAEKDLLKQNVIVPNGMNKDHTSVEPPFQIFPKFFLLRTKILGNLCHCVLSKSANMWGNIFPQANQKRLRRFVDQPLKSSSLDDCRSLSHGQMIPEILKISQIYTGSCFIKSS